MKRLLLCGLAALWLLTLSGLACLAETAEATEDAETASVDVNLWVQIENGGIAVITAENDAPMPDVSSLALTNTLRQRAAV